MAATESKEISVDENPSTDPKHTATANSSENSVSGVTPEASQDDIEKALQLGRPESDTSFEHGGHTVREDGKISAQQAGFGGGGFGGRMGYNLNNRGGFNNGNNFNRRNNQGLHQTSNRPNYVKEIQEKIRQNDPRNNRPEAEYPGIKNDVVKRAIQENPKLLNYFVTGHDPIQGFPKYIGDGASNYQAGKMQLARLKELHNQGLVSGDYVDEAFGYKPGGVMQHDYKSGYVKMAIQAGIITRDDEMYIPRMNHDEGRPYIAGEGARTKTDAIKQENSQLQKILNEKRMHGTDEEKKQIDRLASYMPKSDNTWQAENPYMTDSERAEIQAEKDAFHVKSKAKTAERDAQKVKDLEARNKENLAKTIRSGRPVDRATRARAVRMSLAGELDLGAPETTHAYTTSRSPIDNRQYVNLEKSVESNGIHGAINQENEFLVKYYHTQKNRTTGPNTDRTHGDRADSVLLEKAPDSHFIGEVRKGVLLLAEKYKESGQLNHLKQLEKHVRTHIGPPQLDFTFNELDKIFDPSKDFLPGQGKVKQYNDMALKQSERMIEMMVEGNMSATKINAYIELQSDVLTQDQMNQLKGIRTAPSADPKGIQPSTDPNEINKSEPEVRFVQKNTELSPADRLEAKRLASSARYLTDMYKSGANLEATNALLSQAKAELDQADPKIKNYLLEQLNKQDANGIYKYNKITMDTRIALNKMLMNQTSTALSHIAQVDKDPTPQDVRKDIIRLNRITKNLGGSNAVALSQLTVSIGEKYASLSRQEQEKLKGMNFVTKSPNMFLKGQLAAAEASSKEQAA